MNVLRISKNFTLKEFQSPDTGEVKISSHLVFLLQRLRDKIDAPLIITSGYRTAEHNSAIGGAVNSYHMAGLAADITTRKMTSTQLSIFARVIGFPGIIVYVPKNFMHVDLRDKKYFTFIK